MKKIFISMIVAALSLISGCATEVKPTYSEVMRMGDDCYAVFPNEGLVMIVLSHRDRDPYSNNTYVVAYNPSNAVFALFRSAEQLKSCTKLESVLYSRAIVGRVDFFSVTDGKWKEALDVVVSNPEHFKGNGIAQYILEQGAGGLRQGRGKVVYLKDISTYQPRGNDPEIALKEVKKLTNADLGVLLAQSKRAEAEQKEKSERMWADGMRIAAIVQQRISEAEAVWNNRGKTTYAVGDSVCTYKENYYGNIESITDKRFKISWIGHAATYDGYFFSGVNKLKPVVKNEEMRWVDRDEVAHCDYKERKE